MIYLLVNNDYHLYDFQNLAHSFEIGEITLIKVPHNLGKGKINRTFKSEFTYPYFFSGLKSILNYGTIKKVQGQIDDDIFPNSGDTLLVYTEYELLNQYIIQKFADVNANIWLMEDGLATMALFNMKSEKLPFKLQLLQLVMRKIYGYKNLEMIYDGANGFPIMKDLLFRGVLVSLGKKIKRKIPLIRVSKNIEKMDALKANAAIFLNEDLYNFYCDFPTYIHYLSEFLTEASANFEVLFFKFHPRETEELKKSISQILLNYPNVIIIEQSELLIEEIIDQYRPKFAISFLSASSINLSFFGLEPVYIYHLFEQLSCNSVIDGLTAYLKSINYNFVPNLAAIRVDFNSNLKLEGNEVKTIKEVLLNFNS
ncbi:polysialyltransferase family glycosyltransferase [Pedobacter fastidiosus]|uniref:CDP-Glycerol:Poly(Glycerophosphate) glycerophosphotransferase n=1 Tax=Pedobacter fastidiosus TaxID=2765361 RepID=A0ABR7KRB6_9SPHI|nr:polysialyltransferase family glycosyltransferase [Pedobacter fastidiosus]MBC6110548.1 hypothetical protein [Pedobacter fastidiosus]